MTAEACEATDGRLAEQKERLDSRRYPIIRKLYIARFSSVGATDVSTWHREKGARNEARSRRDEGEFWGFSGCWSAEAGGGEGEGDCHEGGGQGRPERRSACHPGQVLCHEG